MSYDAPPDAIAGTLRELMEQDRAAGTRLPLTHAVALVVPLAVELAERHAAGEVLFVHPSSIAVDVQGMFHVSPQLAAHPPALPRDRACLAPEQRSGAPGGARATVFCLGAILYELLTGESVGPAMRRPGEVDPSYPPALEVLLGKALVGDAAHRPDDLYALAQAIHHLAPANTAAPPPADESHLDHADDFDVDVSMSLLPPVPAAPPVVQAASPYDVMVRQAAAPAPRMSDKTEELAALKARLESDTRPRYVVVRDGMDHGPFSSVELLQQIASHAFEEHDVLKDNISQDIREIRDWPDFAPFAEHARLHRDIKAEKAAIERVVVQERKRTTGKALIGVAVVGALLSGAAVWFFAVRGTKSDEAEVFGDKALNVETDGGLKIEKAGHGRGRGGGVVGTSGGFPQLGGGMSCEAARNAYVETWNMGGGDKKVPADLTAGAYGGVLNNGSYFAHCGVPDNVSVTICAAVQNGHAVGVSVYTKPNHPSRGCIAAAVRRLGFPSHPRLDVTTTTFPAAR